MIEIMTTERLKQLLHEHDDGLLRRGAHTAGSREFCVLEFDAIVRGREWSDKPITLPDLRRLNDARWSSDEKRTETMLPLMTALWDWSEWSAERRIAWAGIVALETVRQIVSELPGLSDEIRKQCRECDTIQTARTAANAANAANAAAADAAAAAYAANANAYAAAHAAAYAAYANAYAAAHAANANAYANAYAAAHAAAHAANANAYAAAHAANANAYAAAHAADHAAYANAYAAAHAADQILVTACRIWIQAAEQTAVKE